MDVENATREQLQAALKSLPSKREELAKVQAERDAIAARVEVGELTRAALDMPDQKLRWLRHEVTEIDNRIRQRLIDTCPDDMLRVQFNEVLARRGMLLKEQTVLRGTIDDLRETQQLWQRHAEETDSDEARSHYRKLAAEEAVKITAAEARLAENSGVFDSLEQQKDEIKAKMIAA